MHSRQSSQSSSKAPSTHQGDAPSYVQQMRMAKATVWAERGPKDAVFQRKGKVPSSTRKGMFGIKIFNGGQAGSNTSAKPSKTKLRLYAAPQHNTLVPRLSASEANDNDDFDNFASAAPHLLEKRTSTAPSLARSSLQQATSRTTSLYNTTGVIDSLPASPGPKPARMDSVTSSVATSSLRDPEDMFTRKPVVGASTVFATYPSSGFTTSRSGSPTQLQQYTAHHLPSDSDEDGTLEQRPRLFIANADLSDSD